MADTLMKRKKPNLSLPQDDDDVMIDILMRLPFESVLALKRVSKRWKDLINSPKFFSFYHYKSLAIVSDYDQLYYLSNTQTNKASVTVEGSRRRPPFTLRRITIESIPRNSFTLTNRLVTCNGVVCVKAADGNFVLYNLFTGASNTVKADPRTIYYSWSCFGFGYDGYEDDYKILVACCYELGKAKKYIKLHKEGNGPFWVYSLRSRGWRRLKGFPYRGYDWDWYIVRLHPCSLKGVLHWGLCMRVDPSKPLIVTYDLHTSRFGEISLPDGYENRSANVCDLEGQLCCWDIKSKAEYRVWVMKEYGVSESWTMLFSIGGSRIRNRCVAPVALYEGRDGRKMVCLVCRIYGKVYWYDIHNGELGVINVP